MILFRVPYPDDPARRQALFTKAVSALSRHGTYEGTPEAGTFRASTPVGGIAGRYRVLNASKELEIELTEKPWIVSAHLVEREVRRLLAQA